MRWRENPALQGWDESAIVDFPCVATCRIKRVLHARPLPLPFLGESIEPRPAAMANPFWL